MGAHPCTWHDGVGHRVGKGLRHIRKPRKPPDPEKKKREQKSTKLSAERGRAAAARRHKRAPSTPPEEKVKILFRLYSRHPAGRIIGGSRRTTCNSKHKQSRAADRQHHYTTCGSTRFFYTKRGCKIVTINH